MMLLSFLALWFAASSPANATSTWMPTCNAKDDPTVWWVITSDKPPPILDFDCPDAFLDLVACGTVINMGRMKLNGERYASQPLFELRYLPYGDWATIARFLDRDGLGVEFHPAPPAEGELSAGQVKVWTRTELMRMFLAERKKSSQASAGVTLHIWTCPEATFEAPTDTLSAAGISLAEHVGRYVLR